MKRVVVSKDDFVSEIKDEEGIVLIGGKNQLIDK